ncbi:MAG TPA: hypothetical protein VF644_03700 [Pyrinomonadaceae bacterium]|jgi:hypothetical protein
MKKTLKFLLPGALALAFVAAPSFVSTVSAQDTTTAAASACNPDEQAALDKKFRDNRTTNRDVAYQAAKEYLAKCSSDTGAAAFVKYLNDWVAKQDVIIKQTQEAEKAQKVAKLCADPIQAAGKAQTSADKAKFGSDIFAGCQQFASQMPNNAYPYFRPVDYGFVVATSNPPINTYNDQTIALAKQAIQKIESNSFGDVKWTEFDYKSKEDALGWLNYIIGTITFYNLNGKEADAVPYFYKSLQHDSPDIKKKFQPYYALGFNYRTQYNKAVQDFQAKYANVTDPTEEFKRDLGIQKALMDRAIDAFARAYKAASDAKVPAAVLETRKKDLEQMYKIRFKDQPLNINEVVATTASKPLPDPASPVTPVIEETPTTTTGATTGSTAAVTPAAETKSAAAAASGNGNGTRERTAGAAPNTTTAKPDAAKPAAKPATTPKKPSR